MRKTIIFGNGLGMALDPNYFSLKTGLAKVWDNADPGVQDYKKLIGNCLVAKGCLDKPTAEEDLDVLQMAISACDFLHSLAGEQVTWLSQHGQNFPLVVRSYFHLVAKYFHSDWHELPQTFIDPLAGFLTNTRSHVATLNYDNLLYGPLITKKVLSGYSGSLIDGFRNSGFSPDNLKRLYGNSFGYYLHLHGSPLFVDRSGQIVKMSYFDSMQSSDILGNHVVLTHVNQKPFIIEASTLLKTYWNHLEFALEESEAFILVGYSGEDKHLNDLVKGFDKPITVVEWDGAGDFNVRKTFWLKTLRCSERNLDLQQMSSILNFNQW
jgi:hypothetical protein